jgi:hypothetical protein
MTNKVDLLLRQSENWEIRFTAHQADGTTILPLLSGSEVNFRIMGIDDAEEPIDILTLTVGDGVVISDPTGGEAMIQVLPAMQETYKLRPSSLLYYEIETVVDGAPSIQVEGKLSIERSLFAATVDPLLFEFQTRFPEFTEGDTTILIYINDAKRIINRNDSWADEDKNTAIVYLAAHFLQLRKLAALLSASGGLQTGQVKSVTVEDRTVSYATFNPLQMMNSLKLSSTVYGTEYLTMLRRNTVWLQRG